MKTSEAGLTGSLLLCVCFAVLVNLMCLLPTELNKCFFKSDLFFLLMWLYTGEKKGNCI